MTPKTVQLRPELHEKITKRRDKIKPKTKKGIQHISNDILAIGMMRLELVESKYKYLNLLYIERENYFLEDNKRNSYPVIIVSKGDAFCTWDKKNSCDHAKFIAEIVGL